MEFAPPAALLPPLPAPMLPEVLLPAPFAPLDDALPLMLPLLFMAVVRRCFLLLLLPDVDVESDIAPPDDDMLPLAVVPLLMLEFEFDCAMAGVARPNTMAATSNCFMGFPSWSCDVLPTPSAAMGPRLDANFLRRNRWVTRGPTSM